MDYSETPKYNPQQVFVQRVNEKLPHELEQSINWRRKQLLIHQINNSPEQKSSFPQQELKILEARKQEFTRLLKKEPHELQKSIDYRLDLLRQLGENKSSQRTALQIELDILRLAKHEYELLYSVQSLNPQQISERIRYIKSFQLTLAHSSDKSKLYEVIKELNFLKGRRNELQRLSQKTNKKEVHSSIEHRKNLLKQMGPHNPQYIKTQIEIQVLQETHERIRKEGITIGILENLNEQRFYSPGAQDPNAQYQDSTEIPRYLNAHTDTYKKLIRSLADEIPFQLSDEIEAVLGLPAYKEGKNIYRTLSEYAHQTYKNRVAILVFDNHPIGVAPDNTEQEVKKFISEHPDMQVAYLKAQFSESARNIGNIRKIPNDVMLELAQRRMVDNPQKKYKGLIMISNDADLIEGALRDDYFQVIIDYFHDDQNKNVDAIAGKIDFSKDTYALVPHMLVGRRLWQYLDIVKRWKHQEKRPHLVGRNSAWRAATYAAFGGYNALRTVGEDTVIGHSILSIRGGRSTAIRHLIAPVLLTSARRDLMAVIEGVPIAYQYSDFKGKGDKVRDFTADELLKLAQDTQFTRTRIKKEIEAIYYAFGRKVDTDPKDFKRAASLMGLKVDLRQEKGKWNLKIVDTSKLEQSIKESIFDVMLKNRIESNLGMAVAKREAVMIGETNQVYLITLANQQILIVRAAHKASSRYLTEMNVFKRLHVNGLRTPKVLKVLPPEKDNPFAIEIMEYNNGTPISQLLEQQPQNRSSILSNIGKTLRRIHDRQTVGFGHLSENAEGSQEFKSWSEVIIRNDGSALAKRLQEKGLPSAQIVLDASKILKVNENYFRNFSNPCLIISDFSTSNLLAHNGDITIIDVEAPLSGDPFYDLAYFAFHNEHRYDIATFYEGYGLKPNDYLSQQFRWKMSLYHLRIGMDALWYATWKDDSAKAEHALKKINEALKIVS